MEKLTLILSLLFLAYSAPTKAMEQYDGGTKLTPLALGFAGGVCPGGSILSFILLVASADNDHYSPFARKVKEAQAGMLLGTVVEALVLYSILGRIDNKNDTSSPSIIQGIENTLEADLVLKILSLFYSYTQHANRIHS